MARQTRARPPRIEAPLPTFVSLIRELQTAPLDADPLHVPYLLSTLGQIVGLLGVELRAIRATCQSIHAEYVQRGELLTQLHAAAERLLADREAITDPWGISATGEGMYGAELGVFCPVCGWQSDREAVGDPSEPLPDNVTEYPPGADCPICGQVVGLQIVPIPGVDDGEV